jgi:hypothetical protein
MYLLPHVTSNKTSAPPPFHSAGHRYSILAETIFAFMSDADDSEHDDVVRAFFRYRVLDLGRLVSRILDITQRTEFETGRTLAEVLPEANSIVLVSNPIFFFLPSILPIY